jgi:hypothetical protein
LTAVRTPPPLDAFVELFWFVRGRPDDLRERVLPNGSDRVHHQSRTTAQGGGCS